MFAVRFLTHQGAIEDLQCGNRSNQMDLVKQVTRDQDTKVELNQQNTINIMLIKVNIFIYNPAMKF